jgi:tol-pal system protein YbgF
MRRILPVLLSLQAAACFYPADRGRLLEAKVEKLTADNERQGQKVDEKIAEVSKALESLDKAARRGDADIGVQFQKTVEDLAQLRGQVETYLFKINELDSGMKALTEDLDKKIAEVAGQKAVEDAEAKRKAAELKRPDKADDFLALAEAKAKDGELGVARKLYDEFLKKWPKGELTGEAHYGLGETYFGEDKCREALFEYQKVIQDFAKTRSAPVAYLRTADCFKKLKLTEESRLALEEVVKQYPRSEAAKTAKGRLQELDKSSPKKKGKK